MKFIEITQVKNVQTILLFSIRISSLVCKFILTLFIARYIGLDALGFYGLVTAATFLIPAFLGLSLMYTISRRAVTQTLLEITRTLLFYSKFLLLLYSALFTISVIYGIAKNQLAFSLIVVFTIFLEHINIDLYTLLLNRGKPLTANILHFIRSALWILSFMLIAFIFPAIQTLQSLFIAWLVGGILSLFSFIMLTRHWPWTLDSGDKTLINWLKGEFIENKFNFLNNSLRTGNQYINHFLISFFLGLDMTGVYVYFMQVFSAMSNLLQTGVIQIARPKLVKAFKFKDKECKNIYTECLKNSISIALVMVAFALPCMYLLTHEILDKPLAVKWFFVFPWVLVLFILTIISLVNQLIFYSQHRDDLLLHLNIILIPLGIFINTILVSQYGIMGAIVSMILIILITIIYEYRYIKRVGF